mgnify:CR=1 FL=1
MKLNDVATIKTNFSEADFWITRRGSLTTVGTPVHEFNREHIGIKVENTQFLLPRFLFICFESLHLEGRWGEVANGTLSLVSIKVSDVRNIELQPR